MIQKTFKLFCHIHLNVLSYIFYVLKRKNNFIIKKEEKFKEKSIKIKFFYFA